VSFTGVLLTVDPLAEGAAAEPLLLWQLTNMRVLVSVAASNNITIFFI
jgi:hypothetical protein